MEADDEAPMSPISCAECGSINWSMGDCHSCGKPLELVEEEGDTPESRPVQPPEASDNSVDRTAAETEARKKAMEDPEMRRQMLRSRIRAMQDNRGRINPRTEVRNARGRRVRGARQERQPVVTFAPSDQGAAPSVDVSAPDLV